jgi:hypothetical protein
VVLIATCRANRNRRQRLIIVLPPDTVSDLKWEAF